MQSTAQDALDVLRKQVALETRGLPDLIVLDLDLPGGTSLTFLQDLRKDSRLTDLPVIAMAWTDDRATARTLAGLAVLDYVVKPMLFADLVMMACGRPRLGRTLACAASRASASASARLSTRGAIRPGAWAAMNRQSSFMTSSK